MKARFAVLVVLLVLLTALSSSAKTTSELTEIAQKFAGALEARQLPELEALFADTIVFDPGKAEYLAENTQEVTVFIIQWLDDPDPAKLNAEFYDRFQAELQEMAGRYQQDPADPAIEQLASLVAEKWVIAYYFHCITGQDLALTLQLAQGLPYSDRGIEIPKELLAAYYAHGTTLGYTYELTGADEPFEENEKWYVQLHVQEYLEGEPTEPWDFVLGFTATEGGWLIDLFRIVPE